MGSCASDLGPFSPANLNWKRMDWREVEAKVRALQMRIAKAVSEGRPARVKKLQRLLTCSLPARLLAVKRVSSNKGKKTPGVDGVVWYLPSEKVKQVFCLKRRGYSSLPLRRVYIRKKNGKLRPLGIPTMHDRAMQALHALALIPVAEVTADPNSYGFRMYRCCADAIDQCFRLLARNSSPGWVWEADITGCFDNLSHQWMLEKIPMDKQMLKAWLSAGYVEKSVFHPTTSGTPQGGIISPTLANMVLDGLERCAQSVVPQRSKGIRSKIHMVRYADDFIITAASKELLVEKVIPAVTEFLAQRGLTLSPEKSKITHVTEGFDFLGFNVRKFGQKLIVRPTKKAVMAITAKTKAIIAKHRGDNALTLIRALNPVIRGWANYYRPIFAHKDLSRVDNFLFKQIWHWVKRRHGRKSRRWLKEQYFCTHQGLTWTFCAGYKTVDGEARRTVLLRASKYKRVPYTKVWAEAHPFDKKWNVYFEQRRQRQRMRKATALVKTRNSRVV